MEIILAVAVYVVLSIVSILIVAKASVLEHDKTRGLLYTTNNELYKLGRRVSHIESENANALTNELKEAREALRNE